MKHIAVRSVAAHILALLHHLDFCRCRFDRKILAVCGIDDAAHDNLKATGCSLVIVAVIAVVDGDKANAHERKSAFEIIARLDVITRKAGKIFDADQVDLPVPDFLHHRRELRTMKICPGIAIIRELKPRIFGKHRMLVKVAVDEHTLVADAVTLSLVAGTGIFISHREADVDADCVVFAHLHRPLYFFDTLDGQLVDVAVLHNQLHSAALMDFDQFNRLVY